MDDEQKLSADHLPPGTTPPIWIDVPVGFSQRDILENIFKSLKIEGVSTTVIYYSLIDENDGSTRMKYNTSGFEVDTDSEKKNALASIAQQA